MLKKKCNNFNISIDATNPHVFVYFGNKYEYFNYNNNNKKDFLDFIIIS